MNKHIDNLTKKFNSLNSIPVDRAIITREEWESIKELLQKYRASLGAIHYHSGKIRNRAIQKECEHCIPELMLLR